MERDPVRGAQRDPDRDAARDPEREFAALKQVVTERHRAFGCGPDSRLGVHLDVAPTTGGGVAAVWTASVREEGPPGVVHGGVQGIVADALAGWATARAHAATREPVLRFPVTTHLDLRFRRPLPTEVPLRLTAHATETGPQRLTSRVVMGTTETPECTTAEVVYRLLDRAWFPNPLH